MASRSGSQKWPGKELALRDQRDGGDDECSAVLHRLEYHSNLWMRSPNRSRGRNSRTSSIIR
jgi:hypothetical protein